MTVLRTVIELNYPVIVFGYGLTFFIMGFAIALQSRSSSRLELARSLAWLAAFGIIYSLFEWGELFAPVHEAFLSPRGIEILHSVHLILLSISFACLFEFGIALLRPLGVGQWLHPVTILLVVSYAFIILVIFPRTLPDPHLWHSAADALARYSMAFSGALLAAYGLREQTFRHIAPLDAPHIVSNLRMAGIALALFAVFGGLLPPPVPYFPGNRLNTDTFEQLLGIPPLVFQALIGLTLAVTIIRALEIFKVETERRIEAMEQQQIVVAERERIARELHDGVIQTVYTASLLVDSARKLAEPDSAFSSRLDKAVGVLNDAIHDLRRNLGELRTAPSGEPLATALQRFAEDPRFRSLVHLSVDIDLPEAEQLSPLRTDQIMAIVTEALSNVVRHANARNVRLAARTVDGHLAVAIQDDGAGLPRTVREGFGLRNMRDRARLLGGSLKINSETGRGTQVLLDIPLEEK